MGSENIAKNGIDIDFGKNDRIRRFKLGMQAQAWLAQKHGTIKKIYGKLSGTIDNSGNKIERAEADEDMDITSTQLEAMIDFIYAGLMRDARDDKPAFTREKVMDLVDEYGMAELFQVIQGEAGASLPEAKEDPTDGQTKKS